MSKSLISYPESQRTSIANRRLESNLKGLGYWAAWDYTNGKRAKLIRAGLIKPTQKKAKNVAE